jgi:hypothetical protein
MYNYGHSAFASKTQDLAILSLLAFISAVLFAILFPIVAYVRRERIWWLTIPIFIYGLKMSGTVLLLSWYTFLSPMIYELTRHFGS